MKDIFIDHHKYEDFWNYKSSAPILNLAITDLKRRDNAIAIETYFSEYGKPAWDKSIEFSDLDNASTLIAPVLDNEKQETTALIIYSVLNNKYMYYVVPKNGPYPTGKNVMSKDQWIKTFASYDLASFHKMNKKGIKKGYTIKATEAYEIEVCTQWCTSVNDGPEHCEEPVCTFEWRYREVPDPPASSSGGSSSSSTSSGSEESDPGTGTGTSTVDFSCASYQFINTSSFFQEAGVRGIRMKVLDSQRSIAREINMPTLIFGLPTFLTKGQAAEFAASSVNRASDAVWGLYRASPTLPNDPIIQNKFIELLQAFLSVKGGTVQRDGTQTDPIVIISNADYDIFGSGDCN